MPASTSSTKFLRTIKWFLRTVFLTIFFVSATFIFIEVFKIKQIILSKKIAIIGLDEIKNQNIFFLSKKTIVDNLLKKNPSFKELSVEVRLPSTLILNITEDKPIGALSVNQGYFYLAANGKILRKTKLFTKNAPQVNFYQKLDFLTYSAGDRLNYKELIMALELIDSFNDLGYKVDKVDIGGTNMILFNQDKKVIIFSSDKKVEEQIYQWQEIVKKFRIEGRLYKEIDLRFDKPIIRF